MRTLRIWRTLLGVEKTFVEDIDLDLERRILIASVRPMASKRNRCGACQTRSPRYDAGDGRRRWRGLDVGSIQVHLEADAPRVSCRVHGVTVAAVPWARHQSGHTLFFDDQVAWLATQTSKTAITVLMRIGIEEISYKRGPKYWTCVVDHDSGRLVWVGRSVLGGATPARQDSARAAGTPVMRC